MNSGLFIFLAVVAIIILICIIIIIGRLTYHSLNSNTVEIEIDRSCSATYDCPLGLQCEQNKCMIPTNGSCSLFPDCCVNGDICYKGRCIPDPGETLNVETYEVVINNSSIVDPNYAKDVISPFTTIHFINQTSDKPDILVYQGNIQDASIDTNYSNKKKGLWILTDNGDNRITYLSDNKLYSRIIDINSLSCLSFDDVCFILCENNVLFLANFDGTNIELKQLDFPTKYNNQNINSGQAISLGRSIVNTLMIIMTNGIWMYGQTGEVSWIPLNDNTDVISTNFVNGKKMILYSDNTFLYGNYSGQWSKNNFPHINQNGSIEMENYWTKDNILALE